MTEVMPQVGGVSADPTVKAVLSWFKTQIGKADQVVEEWHEGSNFYRKYSSGFIEQGGYMSTPRNGDIAVSVSFHKSFSSADTVNVLTTGRMANAASDTANSLYSVTATSFSVYDWAGRTTHWYAFGY